MTKKSLISKFLDDSDFNVLLKIVVLVGTLFFIILFCITKLFYWGHLGHFLGTGIPLVFYDLYLMALIRLLCEKLPEKIEFWLCKMIIIIMIIIGFVSSFWFYRYSRQYCFESMTYLVDHHAKTYHLRWTEMYCPIAEYESCDLELMKGYQIDETYTLCDWCDNQLEPADATFFKRH